MVYWEIIISVIILTSLYILGEAQNYVFGGVYTQGAAVTTYVDPTLKWERTRTADLVSRRVSLIIN